MAEAIVEALPPSPFLVKAEVAGPGFLNLFTGGTNWGAANQRHYPRTLPEILTGTWYTAKPKRG